jgi:hypothetical protein
MYCDLLHCCFVAYVLGLAVRRIAKIQHVETTDIRIRHGEKCVLEFDLALDMQDGDGELLSLG